MKSLSINTCLGGAKGFNCHPSTEQGDDNSKSNMRPIWFLFETRYHLYEYINTYNKYIQSLIKHKIRSSSFNIIA